MEITDTFKLLSDLTRLRLFMLLNKKELCVCELTEIMNESQPKISKHLAKLRDLGLVQTRKDDRFVFYSVVKEDTFTQPLFELINQTNNSAIVKEDFVRLENTSLDTILCNQQGGNK